MRAEARVRLAVYDRASQPLGIVRAARLRT